MRARLLKQDMIRAILRAGSIADKKSVIPILSHVLLEFKDNNLCLKSTDLDHSIIENITAEVDTFGTVAVPASTLGDLVRKTQDGAMLEFSLADKGHKLIVTAGRSKFEIATLRPKKPSEEQYDSSPEGQSDFPLIERIKSDINFDIDAAVFNKLITKTKFSISSEESRHNLNGIYLCVEDGRMKAVSTDGHRLSLSECSIYEIPNIEGMILSRKTIFELKKILDTHSGTVNISFNANQIQFIFDNITLVSKLVDGKFPEYKRVIPEMSGDFFLVNRDEFISSIDRVSIISDEKIRAVKLELSKDSLFINAVNSRIGSGRDEIIVEYDGTTWMSGFNASYLLDVAQAVDGKMLKIYIREALSPILIIDESDLDSLFIVMPMRV